MDLLKKLTIKNLKLNRKRTIVTIIGIILSVALITSVATIYNSAIKSLIEFETYQKGNFHVSFYNVLVDEVKTLKNNRKISDVFLTQDIGYAKLEGSKNEYKPYAFIKAFTKSSLENLSVKLTEGRLPENENEIVIPTHLKTNGRVTLNVGDTITLNVGKRVSDGYELDQSNSFDKNTSEEIIDTTTKTYKIVGRIERPATNIEGYSAPGYTLLVEFKADEQLKQKIVETTKLDNIKNYTLSKYDGAYIVNPRYTNEFIEFNGGSVEENSSLDGDISIKTINNEQYKNYIEKLGLNYEVIKEQAILINNNWLMSKYDAGKGEIIEKQVEVFDYKKNDTISCKKQDNKLFEIQIGEITDTLPFGFSNQTSPTILISAEMFEKYFSSNNIAIYYDSENPNKLQDDIDDVLNGYNYNVNNIAENAEMMKKLFTLVGIFLYGFIIVITLIGVTNIFNTITTNMELRKPEFAMLKSIGMTTKEFNRMIRLETVFMGIKSLLFSVPIGIGLSYLIYNAMDVSERLKFVVPVKAIVIAVIAVFLLITCIMKFSMSRISKQNVIETIRNENI